MIHLTIMIEVYNIACDHVGITLALLVYQLFSLNCLHWLFHRIQMISIYFIPLIIFICRKFFNFLRNPYLTYFNRALVIQEFLLICGFLILGIFLCKVKYFFHLSHLHYNYTPTFVFWFLVKNEYVKYSFICWKHYLCYCWEELILCLVLLGL